MARDDFVLAPCLPEDIEEMTEVNQRAFEENYFSSVCFPLPTITRDGMHRWLREHFLGTMTRPELRNFKVTEVRTGRIAAWARWKFPYKFTEEEKAQNEREKQEKEKQRVEGTLQVWPLGTNVDLCDLKFRELGRLKDKYVDPEEMYVLDLLSTDPAYQRKGLASMLLNHVFALADAEGRKIYVESTETGHPVYEKCGFRDIDLLSLDLSKWGGERPGVNTIMLREPQPVGK